MSGFDDYMKAARLSQYLRGVQSQTNSTPAGPYLSLMGRLSQKPQYIPVWPSPDPTLSSASTSTFTPSASNTEPDPKTTLTIPAEYPAFYTSHLTSLNPTLTNEEIIDRIAQLLGKGRILIGYKVNQEWLAAQLEMDEGKRKVRFVRRFWTPSGNVGAMGPVPRDCRCYVLDVDVDADAKQAQDDKGKKENDLGSSNLRDASNSQGQQSRGSRNPNELRTSPATSRLNRFPTQTQPQVQSSTSSASTPTSTTSQQGLRLYAGFNWQIIPMQLMDIQIWNKHLTPTEIKARLAERVKAGHLKRMDVSIWLWEERWLRGEMAKDGWKDRLGWGFDSTPRGEMPRGAGTERSYEWLMGLQGKEYITLGKL